MAKYTFGIDLATESGPAVPLNVSSGRELAASVHLYANGVINETVPGSRRRPRVWVRRAARN
jgi:L-ribulokinase